MIPINCIHKSWYPIFGELYGTTIKELFNNLQTVSHQPKRENIFKVFSMPLHQIKVVLLGIEPYSKPGLAIGYSFAKPQDKRSPVSVMNIEKEILSSCPSMSNADEIDLLSWVDQGVFLLNTALTVETGKVGTHFKYWDDFTIKVIQLISINTPCIWLLMGNRAQSFAKHIKSKFNVVGYDRDTIESIPIDSKLNYVLPSTHPIVGREGFFGCDHFYLLNRILEKKGEKKIIY